MYRIFILWLILLCLSFPALAHKDTVETFLHYDGKPLAKRSTGGYYFRRAYKEGNRWFVKDYYVKEQRLYRYGIYSDDKFEVAEGMVTTFHRNGTLESKSRYVFGKKEGLHKKYDTAGRLTDSAFYLHDMPCKVRYMWSSNGELCFKGIYDEEGKGTGTETFYHPDGSIKVHGKISEGHNRDSVWVGYYKSGKPSFIGTFDKDSLIQSQCYDEEGNLQPGRKHEVVPEFKMDVNKYLAENLTFPKDVLEDGGRINCKVFVAFVVEEDGTVVCIGAYSGCHPSLEEEAMRVMKSMPRWQPGRQYNQPVKVYYTLPVNFVAQD